MTARASLRTTGRGIEPRWRLREHLRQGAALRRGIRHAAHDEVAILGEIVAHARRRWREARQEIPGDLPKAFLLPGVGGNHQMTREALDQPAGAEIIKA